ncbi:MAG: hypothetical protein CVV27_09135, partial [Candidatus Melainabacteria bacterium HGW-Melainabacteria-1]
MAGRIFFLTSLFILLVACEAPSTELVALPRQSSSPAEGQQGSGSAATASAKPEGFPEFLAQSVAFKPNYRQNQASLSQPLPIRDYPLPRGVKLSEIQIEK